MRDCDIDNHMTIGANEAFYGTDDEDVELIAVCSVCDCGIYDDMEYEFRDGEFICAECAEAIDEENIQS